ncbi:MAG: Flagellar basal-body rod protein FlgB [uncultured Nocardioidaceae bacterium]|uniref:Flagellar basal body rod protein FlgB n=1 Tax=uncultured Nocardioidaceae bacterium TaxID=253824 RepID=A0A6J4KXE0_9ACTN|nr:MAG: Flagellar basal-body rod protein FlgB [uncultured Nocardioidaceae bacterium]
MSFPVLGADRVEGVLHTALAGLSLRQDVIADNIANIDTPDFRASSVDFESSLRTAVARGGVPAEGIALTATPTLTPVGPNGNNVDLRKETMAAMQTVFQYQTVTRAVTDRLALVRTAAGA